VSFSFGSGDEGVCDLPEEIERTNKNINEKHNALMKVLIRLNKGKLV
jgi:hypothetical protein